MLSYFLRRLALVIPTFLGITILIFAITRFVPGGPVERMLSKMQAQGDGAAAMTTAGATRHCLKSKWRNSMPFMVWINLLHRRIWIG